MMINITSGSLQLIYRENTVPVIRHTKANIISPTYSPPALFMDSILLENNAATLPGD